MTLNADFQYAAAHVAYKNIDKLIHYANADGRLNVFYSTPSRCVAAAAAGATAGQQYPSTASESVWISSCAQLCCS